MPTALRVLFPLPLPPFSYLLPFEQGTVSESVLGCRVAVPWQGGLRLGLVVGSEPVAAGRTLELREVVSRYDERPFVDAERLAWLAAVAERSCAPLGLVLAALLPGGLDEPLEHSVRALPGVALPEVPEDRWQDASALPPERLELYRSQGLLRERVVPREPKRRVLRALREPGPELTGKPQAAQLEALQALLNHEEAESAAAFARDQGVSEAALRALVKKGYAAYLEVSAPPPPLLSYEPKPLEPRDLGMDPHTPRLSLAGGSRLTRLAALAPLVQRDLAAGRSVLVLVPEGVLLEGAAAGLGGLGPLQVLSGELSDAQRRRLWQELPGSGPLVLVGTYLALLAPLPRLGRVVVLEAGSSSYKLPSGPRLFVPSAAGLLAERLGVPIAYADALESPETLFAVPASRCYRLPRAPLRVHRLDLSQSRSWPLGADLVQLLKQIKERERQAILLSPRRGFSAALGCERCGYLAECPNCDLTLRYHRNPVSLRCHQCGYGRAPPKLCPNCQSSEIGPMRGAGSEWLLRELAKHLGEFPAYQYDGDRRDDLSPLLGGEPGVVVATTAILRHPPLPKLSLIGVTLLDTLLGASDFRAEEEVLRLLLNLAELQPERRPLVLLQTFQPEHPLLRVLTDEDPDRASRAFMAEVLERRERYRYPPFVNLAKVQVSARDAATAQQEATGLAEALEGLLQSGEDILGPSPAPVARLKGRYAFQLFVRSPEAERLNAILAPARAYAGRARVRVDIDPRDIGGLLD